MTREERRKAIRRYVKKNPDVASMVIKALGAYDDQEKCIRTNKGKWLKRDRERDTIIRYITANKYGVSEDSELADKRITFCDGYVSGYIDGECSADSLYTEMEHYYSEQERILAQKFRLASADTKMRIIQFILNTLDGMQVMELQEGKESTE